MLIEDSHLRRAELHAALADPHRLALVDLLAASDRSPSELGAELGLGSNLLAHHTRVLERADLVERAASHGDARRRYLRLRKEALADLLRPPGFEARRLLFVCTANSARSQLAAAMWNQNHVVGASSAGTRPAQRVHPKAVREARRRGLDISTARPRLLGPLDGPEVLLVTVCDLAHEELRTTTGAPALHWSVADPAEVGSSEAFRRAADEIAERVAELAPLVAPVP